MHVKRDALQRLRLVMGDAQVLNLRRRLRVGERGLRARRRRERAAEMGPLRDSLVRHHFRNRPSAIFSPTFIA